MNKITMQSIPAMLNLSMFYLMSSLKGKVHLFVSFCFLNYKVRPYKFRKDDMHHEFTLKHVFFYAWNTSWIKL